MREQVCIYMCPWPRIQGAMLDDNSLTITYNDWRGEPRTRHKRERDALAAANEPVGDCVDCNACVAVCPMGIDIRNGQQLECITCGLCIDACDNVMEKVGLPKGLISYTTFDDYAKAKAGNPQTVPALQRILRPRTMIYFGVWALIGLVMLASLTTRDRIGLTVLHDRNPLFTELSSGDFRNGYTVKALNMVAQPRRFRLTMEGLEGHFMEIAGSDAAPGRVAEFEVGADVLRSQRIYVTGPGDGDRAEFAFRLEEIQEDGSLGEAERTEATFYTE
jgi:cytochrome c oxidase accessory protein FixG